MVRRSCGLSRPVGAAVCLAALVAASCSGGSSAEPNVSPTTETIAPLPASTAAPSTDDAVDGEPPEPPESAPEATMRWADGDSAYLFDQEQLHTFEIDLPVDALADIDADPVAEEYVEGSLTFDGETLGAIGVRYKGSVGAFVNCTDGPNPLDPSGAKICTKLSMKLKINWTDPDALFYGVRKVQLHSQNLDPTKMHERLGYWLFREMGVAAPRSTHARVVVNGEYLGLFALTEQIDGRFTRENFADGTGNLYKEIWPFDSNGEVPDAESFVKALKTNEDEDPNADIVRAFADGIGAASGQDALAAFEQRADLDRWLRYWVVDRTIRHDDGPFHWYCNGGVGSCAPHNFYLYEDPSAETVDIVAWDLDNAFSVLDTESNDIAKFVITVEDGWGEITNDCNVFPSGVLNLLQRSAACDPLMAALALPQADYDALLVEFLAGPFAQERVEEQLDVWAAQVADAIAEAAALHDDAATVADWQAALDRFKVVLGTARAI